MDTLFAHPPICIVPLNNRNRFILGLLMACLITLPAVIPVTTCQGADTTDVDDQWTEFDDTEGGEVPEGGWEDFDGET
ncbi:hypothetical protein JW905_03240, partial [bacterium]|nr:hypothetical protein [candidate division CSSED10-310 bacterium]